MTLIEVVAAAFLLLGSFLVIRALVAADRWEAEDSGSLSRPRRNPAIYRKAA